MAGLSTASPQSIPLWLHGFAGFPFLSLPDGASNRLWVGNLESGNLEIWEIKLNINPLRNKQN
jgi:hypothetical protein